jgi:hypothetical protein
MQKKFLTVIFPMAGRGARFGNRFKPFLPLGKERFIEAAVAPFIKWREKISSFVFVYLEEQDHQHNVAIELHKMFPNLPVRNVVLSNPTKGPAETVCLGIDAAKVTGEVICCDCDHAIDIAPLLIGIERHRADAIVPVWPLDNAEVSAWSVVAIDRDDRVVGIEEKKLPLLPGEKAGAIGCTYFRDAAALRDRLISDRCENLSEALRIMIRDKGKVTAVRIEHAEFFGDPERLERALIRTGRRLKESI